MSDTIIPSEAPVEQPPLAEEQATGLRALADLIEANPQLAFDLRYAFSDIYVFLRHHTEDQKARLAEWTRVGLGRGWQIAKEVDDHNQTFDVLMSMGPVRLKVIASRDEVCERIVVGTEEITRQVPDPEAPPVPLVEVTETVEKVEWRCTPILAEAAR